MNAPLNPAGSDSREKRSHEGGTHGPAHWAPSRALLIALVLVPTLVVVFYRVEDWRGRRAWDRCRAELVSKGEKLDWSAFAPVPVADDQNFFKAPLMDAWFNRQARDTNALRRLISPPPAHIVNPPATIRELKVLPATAPPSVEVDSDALGFPAGERLPQIEIKDTELLAAVQKLAEAAKIPVQIDPTLAFEMDNRGSKVESKINGRLESMTFRRALALLLRQNQLAAELDPAGKTLRIKRAQPSLAGVFDWYSQFEPEFAALEEACRRPVARLGSEFEDPHKIPQVNVPSVRVVAQALALRAKASLLAGKPDDAMRDMGMILRLVDVCMGGRPTFVSAMVAVAVGGVYVDAFGEGLSENLWSEAQMAAIQGQLRKLDLPEESAAGSSPSGLMSHPIHAVRAGERAAALYALENRTRERLARLFIAREDSDRSVWRTREGVYLMLCPRGWILRNMAVVGRVNQAMIESVDFGKRRVLRDKSQEAIEMAADEFSRLTPYNFLASICTPSYERALMVCSRIQVLVSQGVAACALERWRRQKGGYPEKLEELVPVHLPRVPGDLLDGEPLKYRRTKTGYVLYSVGWNEKDDGGTTAMSTDKKAPGLDLDEGDWVWPYRPRSKVVDG